MYELYHGDALDILPLLPEHTIDMVFADLPYGTTQNKWDSIISLDILWPALLRVGKQNTPYVMTAQTPFDKILGVSNIKMLRYEWIWQKEQGTGHLNSKKQPLKNHENILVFYNKQCMYNPQMREGTPYKQLSGKGSSNYNQQVRVITDNRGERYPLSTIKIARDYNKLHPTQKPVALLEYLILTYTNAGDIILDPVMGSGTTGVAAMNTGRRFIGIEKEAQYFNTAQKRIQEAYERKQNAGMDTVITG